jgi:GT2 family glycosyltransferase
MSGSCARVSAVLANWNGMRHIEQCLEALRTQSRPPDEIVVVDNGSTDGSQRWLRERAHAVKLIENEDNAGFAAGYNQAIRASRGERVLIINTDVFLEPGFLEHTLAGMEGAPDIGSATGLIYQQATREWLNGGFWLRRQIRLAHSAQRERVAQVFGCTGALMLCRRAMLEDIAVEGEFFDESYFCYGEDIDLSWRAQLRGWRALFVPQARAYHVGSGSLDGHMRFIDKPALFQRHTLKNRYLTVLKNASVGVGLRLLPWLLISEPAVWLYLLVRRPLSVPYLLLLYPQLCRLLPAALARRAEIQRRSVVRAARINRAFRSS